MPEPGAPTDTDVINSGQCELSIVVPARNEADCIDPLVKEIERVILPTVSAELIVVDDGSTDGTAERLLAAAGGRPWLRVLRFDTGRGQSAALAAGIAAARGQYLAMLDADLQNDPADLPHMLRRLKEEGADLVQGDRSAVRRDSWARRFGAALGHGARRLLLGDRVRDTGCSARVMRRDLARRLPLEYRGMHRFIPTCCAQMGARVLEQPVSHRPRTAGTSKYGIGVFSRGLVGLIDCFAVRWMARRRRDTSARDLTPRT